MESIQRISQAKLNQVNTNISTDEVVKDLVRCGYIKSADLADRFGNPADLDPAADPDIVGPGAIFTSAEFSNNRDFQKTASVMKLVLEGYAGAGTITMGGYDYHTGERGTGERRDELAGRCMGACLEYAARVGMPLMLYVFSDGSVSSNGRLDDSEAGRGKGNGPVIISRLPLRFSWSTIPQAGQRLFVARSASCVQTPRSRQLPALPPTTLTNWCKRYC